MRISLIGMSGSGKSHWSKQLEQKGFIRFGCDDLIEQKLQKELKPLGYSGINDVSKWMGQPYEEKYFQNNKKYLELEKETMLEIFTQLGSLPRSTNVIIDTTGSIIYTGKKIMQTLARLTKIVFLEIPESRKKEMYEFYLRDPKPVIWGNIFKKRAKESDTEALCRCYPKLLEYRTKKYKKYAALILDSSILIEPAVTAKKFIEMIP